MNTVMFLGDLVERGPGITAVLRLVMGMVSSGHPAAEEMESGLVTSAAAPVVSGV